MLRGKNGKENGFGRHICLFICLCACSLAYLFPEFVSCCNPMTLVRGLEDKMGINIWEARKRKPQEWLGWEKEQQQQIRRSRMGTMWKHENWRRKSSLGKDQEVRSVSKERIRKTMSGGDLDVNKMCPGDTEWSGLAKEAKGRNAISRQREVGLRCRLTLFKNYHRRSLPVLASLFLPPLKGSHEDLINRG